MPEASKTFDALSEEFYSVWLRFHPDKAVAAGISGYEHLLPAQSDDELAALGSWLETLIVALEELDYGALDEERQIDLRLMFGAARVEHRELLERDWRRRDPLRFLPVREIYRLTLQPPENLRDPLARLLGAVPEYLRTALLHLRSRAELIPAELVSAAIDEAELGRCYLRELVLSPWLRRCCSGWSEIESLADQACSALASYRDGLRGEIAARAAGAIGCGEAHLAFLFVHRHFLPCDPAEASSILREMRELSAEGLNRCCSQMGLEASDAWRYLAARRVERGDRAASCRREAERLEAFLRRTGLCPVPGASVRVRERPACPRPRRSEADYVPDPGRGWGSLFLSPVGPEDDGGEPRSLLLARCRRGTWGGNHLFAFATGEEGHRLARRLCDKDGFASAWSLYLDDRLLDMGYLEGEDQLFALLRRRDAVDLALLDLDLHLGRVGHREARERLAAIPRTHQSDLIDLVRRPGTFAAGALGWRTLSRSLADNGLLRGEPASLSNRHHRLLARGAIPVTLGLSGAPAQGSPRGQAKAD